MKNLKYLILGLILLFLFHFESLNIGPIKISHLWKGILLLYFLFQIIFIFKIRKKTNLYVPLIWLALLQLVNIEFYVNPTKALLSFSTLIILPIIGIYILNFSFKKLQNGLMFFASFFILSFIPYELGFLKSIEEGYDLLKYGGQTGLIGPFQNPHSASLTLGVSLIVIINFWFNKTFNKSILLILIILGFYFLINTYVRTGLAMAAIGLIPIIYHFSKKSIKSFSRVILTGSVLFLLMSSWILTNETLINRIKGEGKYGSEDTFESYGSGRGGIYLGGIETFSQSTLLEKIIGMGMTEVEKANYNRFGLKIGSHNAFLDILLGNGIIGLALFLVFLYRILALSLKDDTSPLLKSLFFAYITMAFFQGYERITVNLLLFIAVACVIKKNTIIEIQNK